MKKKVKSLISQGKIDDWLDDLLLQAQALGKKNIVIHGITPNHEYASLYSTNTALATAFNATGKVFYTKHAQERMNQRNISRLMVKNCLLAGVSNRPIHHNEELNTYECRMSHYMAGVNYDVVVAIDLNDPTAIIVTVINTRE